MTRRLDRNPRSTSVVLGSYLREIQSDALLTAEQERTLAAAIARGDRDARATLIRANLRLVVTIARDYLHRGLSLEDLVGEGNLGLIRASEEYDPSFGTRFSTYAAYWIKQAIRHALINTTATIRLPAHMVGLLTKWRRAERTLARALGYTPSPDQIAAELGLTASQCVLVERALRANRLTPEGSGGDEAAGWTYTETPDAGQSPEEQLEAAEESRELMRRLALLDDRERMIVTLRYGLGGQPPLTLKEVGARLGVTREWVRKIEVRAVQKLDEADDSEHDPAVTRVRPRTIRQRRRLQPA